MVNAKKDKFQKQESWHHLDCISRSPRRGMQWKSEKESATGFILQVVSEKEIMWKQNTI